MVVSFNGEGGETLVVAKIYFRERWKARRCAVRSKDGIFGINSS